MYPVSSGFHEAVKAPERRIFGRVIIDYTDTYVGEQVTVVSSDQANAPALLPQVADGFLHPFRRWASCDGSTFADGLSYPCPSIRADGQMGWWGLQMAGERGNFGAPPVLTMDFSARQVQELRVVGDSIRGEFPVDFEFRLFGAGNVLLLTHTVTGNAIVQWSEIIPILYGVTRCTLTISCWSHVGRQAKILEASAMYQETYEGNDIMSINLLEERDISSGRIPVGAISANEIVLRLNNSDRRFDADNRQSPLYGLVKPNRRIRAWLGVELTPGGAVEWVPLGTFWSGGWHVPSDKVYITVSGRDRLEIMQRNVFAPGLLLDQSLYTLAERVFVAAGMSQQEYRIDSALQKLTMPYVIFSDGVTHREALRQIAEAALGQVYVDRDGIIRVEGSSYIMGQNTFVATWMLSAQSVTIRGDDYFRRDTPMHWTELVNHVEVEAQSLVLAQSREIYRSVQAINLNLGTTVYRLRYNVPHALNAVAALVGAPGHVWIESVTYYTWGADVSIRALWQSASATTVVVTGQPLEIQNPTLVVATDEASIREHGAMAYRYPANHLVQTPAHAQAIANTLVRAYSQPRRMLDLDWRGNPALTLGDMIIVAGADWSYYWTSRQELDYDGALRARLEGRLMR